MLAEVEDKMSIWWEYLDCKKYPHFLKIGTNNRENLAYGKEIT